MTALDPTTEPAPRKRGRPAKTRVSGKDLVPDLAQHQRAVSREYWFWVGAVDDELPYLEGVDLAGMSFPKRNEDLIPDPARTGKTTRVPVPGTLVNMDARRFRLLRERLTRSVIRITGTGEHRRAQRILIPTAAELEEREKEGRPAKRYVQHPGDRPLAEFVYVQFCDNQDRPRRGVSVPPPVSETGLEWPEPIDE